MKKAIKTIRESLLHLCFPHLCEGCGSDMLARDQFLCLACLYDLPHTGFAKSKGNTVEQIFWGRLPVENAYSQFYFTKHSLVQRLMHAVKYRGNKELGHYLGRIMGYTIAESSLFDSVDFLVPLPLSPVREKQRGYNQATLLCQGISSIGGKPILAGVVSRDSFSESQTKKGRIARWENMAGRFACNPDPAIDGKHLLLIDDVVTTGASLEACGRAILEKQNVRLSVATLCFSSH